MSSDRLFLVISANYENDLEYWDQERPFRIGWPLNIAVKVILYGNFVEFMHHHIIFSKKASDVTWPIVITPKDSYGNPFISPLGAIWATTVAYRFNRDYMSQSVRQGRSSFPDMPSQTAEAWMPFPYPTPPPDIEGTVISTSWNMRGLSPPLPENGPWNGIDFGTTATLNGFTERFRITMADLDSDCHGGPLVWFDRPITPGFVSAPQVNIPAVPDTQIVSYTGMFDCVGQAAIEPSERRGRRSVGVTVVRGR